MTRSRYRLVPRRLIDLGSRWHPAPRRIRHEGDRLLAERSENVPVAGIAGCRQRHLGACVEQGQEGQHEGRRGPSRDHHPLRGDRDAVASLVVSGDGLAQRGQTQRHRIPERLAVERPSYRLQRGARRGRTRLAHLHVDDLVTLGFAGGGSLHHIHDHEWRHRTALGGLEGQCRPRRIQACLCSLRSFHAPLRCWKPSNRHGCALTGHWTHMRRPLPSRQCGWRVNGMRLIVGAVRVA